MYCAGHDQCASGCTTGKVGRNLMADEYRQAAATLRPWPQGFPAKPDFE